MNIFEFALKMELDGEEYYRSLSEKTAHEDLKRILESLADDELRHYEIIQLAQKQMTEAIESNPSLSREKNVFNSMDSIKDSLNKQEVIAKLKDEQIDVYREALKKEKDSVALYQRLTKAAEKPEEMRICQRLMQEEEQHVEVIENIIEMLNRVSDWVEAAEFNHSDNY